MTKLLTIGLTGPTGSGKSTVKALVDEYGCRWLDCDVIAREIVEPGKPALAELAEQFGADIIEEDGSLNRALLAQRAFPTEEGRKKLNSITHPHVLSRLQELSQEAFENGKHVIIDAPLLFEGKVDTMCHTVVAVLAEKPVRLQRIMERDGITQERAWLRMNAQPDDRFYSSRAEYTIYNNGSRKQFIAQARAVLDEIFTMAGLSAPGKRKKGC